MALFDLSQTEVLLIATALQLAVVVAAYFVGRGQGLSAARPSVATGDGVRAEPARLTPDQLSDRMGLLFRLAPDALLLCDTDGNVIDVNDYTVELSGYSREELLHRSLAELDFVARDERVRALETFATLAGGGDLRPVEFLVRSKDGRTLPVEVRGDRIPWPGGVSVLISARDISEHKKAQSRIRDQQARLTLLFDQIPAHVWTTDLHLKILTAAGRGLAAIGVTEADLVGRPLVEAMSRSPATEQGRQLHLQALAGQTNPFVATIAGNIIEGAIGPLRDETGTVEGVIGIALNVTEQAQANRRLAQREALLEQAQVMANMGSWEWDLLSNEAYWSPHVFRLLGVEPASDPLAGEKRGDKLMDAYLSFVVEEDRPVVLRAREDALGKGIPYAVEHRVPRPDGSVRWLFSFGQIDRDAAGKPLRTYGFVQDITEQKTGREEVRKLNAELEQRVHDRTRQLEAAVDDLRSFSYAVSHDLRQPLRTIAGFLAILEEEAGQVLNDDAKAHLDRVKAAAHRMDALIGDLLALSRVTNAPLSRTHLDLSAMAAEVAREVAATEPERSAEWVIEPGLTVDADLGLLRLVLENFLGNAWKFTRGRADARIEFGAEPAGTAGGGASAAAAFAGGVPCFFVRDNGAGFDASQASRLFQPFSRLHDAKEFEGTGVGLATVARIIRRHGGQIRAEGRRGMGATFRFSLSRGEAPPL